MARVIRARKAGFCMGVALALRKLDKAVESCPRGAVATLGEIFIILRYWKNTRRREFPVWIRQKTCSPVRLY